MPKRVNAEISRLPAAHRERERERERETMKLGFTKHLAPGVTILTKTRLDLVAMARFGGLIGSGYSGQVLYTAKSSMSQPSADFSRFLLAATGT